MSFWLLCIQQATITLTSISHQLLTLPLTNKCISSKQPSPGLEYIQPAAVTLPLKQVYQASSCNLAFNISNQQQNLALQYIQPAHVILPSMSSRQM
jgi:hypothetical protein